MKPPKFHIGQAVVCVLAVADNRTHLPPQAIVGQYYTVRDLHDTPFGWLVRCWEWPDCIGIHEDHFAPVELLPEEALAALLEETLTLVVA